MSKNTQLGNLVNGIYVDSTGRVGIGTQVPVGKFNIVDGTNKSLIFQDSGVADTFEVAAYSASGGTRNLQLNAATLIFGTGTAGGSSSTERMRITSAGNVGIGTSSPGYKLSVVGPNAGNAISWTDNFNNTGYLGIRLGTSVAIGADGNLVFETAATERMRITSGGNVGIGGASSEGAASDDRVLTIHNSNSTGSMRSMIRFTNFNSGTAWPNGAFLTTDSSNNFYISNLEPNDIIFQTNGTARLYLTGDGKMSIPYTTLAYTGNMTMYWNNSTGVVGVLTSSRRFKKNIVSLTSEQAKIALDLNPVEYTRLETNEREYGFIAEEVKEAGLGLLVPEMDGSPITVDYARLSVFAIAMIKEQQKAIQELSAEVQLLKNK